MKRRKKIALWVTAVVVVVATAIVLLLCVNWEPEIPKISVPKIPDVRLRDGQSVQLPSAEANGIVPMEEPTLIDSLVECGSLVKVSTNKDFVLERLTHSYPYLVPKAEKLLHDIGADVKRQMADSTMIIVTSLLRTNESVARLQKSGNQNSVTKSCHLYGTTFDITYARFAGASDANKALENTLIRFRLAGRCHVLYEVGQTCYHITVR